MYPPALHVGGLDGISCQHMQVLMTNVIQKHWEWQEEKNTVMKHATVVRPTLYLASLDIKTALNEERPKQVAKIMDNHNTHGWIIAALLREMLGLERPCFNAWKAVSLSIDACDKMATQTMANVEGEWMKQRKGVLMDIEAEEEVHQIAVSCGPTTSGLCHTLRNTCSRC